MHLFIEELKLVLLASYSSGPSISRGLDSEIPANLHHFGEMMTSTLDGAVLLLIGKKDLSKSTTLETTEV